MSAKLAFAAIDAVAALAVPFAAGATPAPSGSTIAFLSNRGGGSDVRGGWCQAPRTRCLTPLSYSAPRILSSVAASADVKPPLSASFCTSCTACAIAAATCFG
jgi:hypothetical protein